MDCRSHLLANACNAGLMDVKYDYVRIDTEVTRRNMQRCIAWTKQSQKGEKALETAQNNVGLTCKKLITPVKTLFVYLIHSFRSLLENKVLINYLYGLMENIPDIIRGKSFFDELVSHEH